MGLEAAHRLGEVIGHHRWEIEKRWLDRVSREIVETPGVELTHLRDAMPDYLVALVHMLTGPNDSRGAGARAWSDVAREHGITRVHVGFDVGQLVREFIALRQVIREVALDAGFTEVHEVDGLLADILDAAIVCAVTAYMDARDFEARRSQAENVGFLTHELRNPLSTASLSSATLRKTVPAGHEKLLDALDRALARMAQLIDGMLLTQKLDSGEVPVHREQVKVGPFLESALEVARLAAKRKGLAFEVSGDPELTLRTDPELTRSAIQNLADNAVKYTDQGGVQIRVEDRAQEVVFHVRDTCYGLSQEELRTIFAPFRRGHTRKAGTGLGLAIAKRAVEIQGGSIAAESPEPTGCHFWFTLPKSGD